MKIITVTNGTPHDEERNELETLAGIKADALQRSGYSTIPAENWELKDKTGKILNETATLGHYVLPGGVLFIALKTGFGG